MKTYHIIMSSGAQVDVSSTDAASAIGQALRRKHGETAKRCWCDGITYEIPKHTAFAPSANVARGKPEDFTAPMFPEDLILSESRMALRRKRDDAL